MGLIHTGIPHELALRIQAASQIGIFIETGTFRGDTTAWAAERFARVVTMEINPGLHQKAAARFSSQRHVECHLGDCRTTLESLLPGLGDVPSLIWLDAHLCGGEDHDSPLLEEIGLINRFCPGAAILIDDARFILSAQDGRRLCLLEDLVRALECPGTKRYLAVFEDVVIAVPSTAQAAVDDYCRERLAAARHMHSARMEWRKSPQGRIVSRLQQLSGYPMEARPAEVAAPAKISVLRRKIRSGFVRMARMLEKKPDRYLRKVKGVIHVGGNIGQERFLYARYGLEVIWVEPDPEVFEKLKDNLVAFPRQRALQHLISDRDGDEHAFYIANNDGASSSLLDLKLHKEVWPEVAYEKTLTLRGITLATLVEREGIDLRRYDALVLDTQGTELMVMKGAGRLLERFTWIQVEVADFEAYEGGCQVEDIRSLLLPMGYQETLLRRFGHRPQGGCYYDFVYKKRTASGVLPERS